MIKVLVTGKDSQLAKCLNDIKSYPSISFTFKDSIILDITDNNSVEVNFTETNYDYCVNCAAYTAVDLAEEEPEKARNINTIGVKNLAEACEKHKVTLIHISTDFVFDGESKIPYSETDRKNPLGVYGKTKSDGENKIIDILDSYFIIRTSWLYSQYNTNFLKTMLSLSKIKEEISVVNDQIGCPTNANDLADLICNIISSNSKTFDIYHFCNKGEVNWFGFAEEIFKKWNLEVGVKPIKTIEYPTPAKRPSYSVLDTSKTEKTFHFNINNWKDALGNLKLIQNKE
jgi:dTDP-4-dehydrorhamnose reductase